MRPRRASALGAHTSWACEPLEPVLDVEVNLLAAPGDDLDWLREGRGEEVIAIVEERCAKIVAARLSGRIEHVRQTPFNHRGMTVHISIAAPSTPAVDAVVEGELDAMQQALETNLQSYFAWEHAAVSVQIETNPAYEARYGRSRAKSGRRDDITVYQPPGGSNAIAPVIVTLPQIGNTLDGGPYHALPVRGRERSAAVAGWLGALCALGVAAVSVLAVGPLTDRIGELYEQRERIVSGYDADIRVLQSRLSERNQRIAALQAQNANLNATIRRLSARRGQAASRWDQPPTALPDTGQVVVGAADTAGLAYGGAGSAGAAP